MHTTLNKIREKEPCAGGWEKLLRTLNKTKADDEPLSLITILDSNGLDDALWCLQAVDGYEREKRLLAVGYARQVKHLMTDKRSIDALDVAERFANGQATQQELESALGTASVASNAAFNASGDTAWHAAWAAARAAMDAVRAAALSASAAALSASAAALNAAKAAAIDAAIDAERSAQAVMFRKMFGEK